MIVVIHPFHEWSSVGLFGDDHLGHPFIRSVVLFVLL